MGTGAVRDGRVHWAHRIRALLGAGRTLGSTFAWRPLRLGRSCCERRKASSLAVVGTSARRTFAALNPPKKPKNSALSKLPNQFLCELPKFKPFLLHCILPIFLQNSLHFFLLLNLPNSFHKCSSNNSQHFAQLCQSHFPQNNFYFHLYFRPLNCKNAFSKSVD